MMSLYGSLGLPSPVIKVTAEGRRGAAASFTEFMCLALREAYGEDRQVSLGGVFVMKKGRARYHVMPPSTGGCRTTTSTARWSVLPYSTPPTPEDSA